MSLETIWKWVFMSKMTDTDDMSPYPTVVMVTTAHQNPSGILLKWEDGLPASAK